MDGTASGSRPVAGFGVSGIEPEVLVSESETCVRLWSVFATRDNSRAFL